MRNEKKERIRQIVEQLAARERRSVQEIRREIHAAIDAAYHNTDPVVRENFRQLFGQEKPSIEEFIAKTVASMGPK